MTLEAIKYIRGNLQVLDQLQLPFITKYETITNASDGHQVIKTMKVRGAPAIAIVAALSLAVELHNNTFKSGQEAVEYITQQLDYLKTSRPTAVNLFEAAARLLALVLAQKDASAQEVVNAFIAAAEQMLVDDIKDNKNIGMHGSNYILERVQSSTVRVLTHCNTGSLATAGHGTALGIIRDLQKSGKLEHAYCTETRPYNQGSRLTAYELVYEKIPATLVCDSMVSALLLKKNINAIIVGADRVAANGDTANKIGTYQLAITAKYHNVMFIVAAPVTSIDLQTPNGDAIEIEQRSGSEVTSIKGKIQGQDGTAVLDIAAPGIGVWNPAFDVVPAELITCIVTERGVIEKKVGETSFRINEFLAQ